MCRRGRCHPQGGPFRAATRGGSSSRRKVIYASTQSESPEWGPCMVSARSLESCLKTGDVPVETQLLFGQDPARLLGFYAVRPLAFYLRSKDDQVTLRSGRA